MKKLLALLVTVPTLAACNNTTAVHCEHDGTDTVVDDSYCYDQVPGYEWDEIYDTDNHYLPTKRTTVRYQPPTYRYTPPKTMPVPKYVPPAPAPKYAPAPPAPKYK